MRARVCTVFDVRGTALTVGDIVRGMKWAETENSVMFRATAEHLSLTSWKPTEPPDLVATQTYSCTQAQWRSLEEKQGCVWQMTDMLDGACLRVCVFMRIVLDEPATDPDSDDLFYVVMQVLDPDASPDITKPSADSVMLLIPHRPRRSSVFGC